MVAYTEESPPVVVQCSTHADCLAHCFHQHAETEQIIWYTYITHSWSVVQLTILPNRPTQRHVRVGVLVSTETQDTLKSFWFTPGLDPLTATLSRLGIMIWFSTHTTLRAQQFASCFSHLSKLQLAAVLCLSRFGQLRVGLNSILWSLSIGLCSSVRLSACCCP